MDKLNGHGRPFTVRRILARLTKMKFAEEIRRLAHPEPVVVRKSKQDAISIAIVDYVQIDRFIKEVKEALHAVAGFVTPDEVHILGWLCHRAQLLSWLQDSQALPAVERGTWSETHPV